MAKDPLPMKDKPPPFASYLSESTEEEFGAGTELPTTAFLILGLLTFWIYTVWAYYREVAGHLQLRLTYFRGLLNSSRLSSENQKLLSAIEDKGFTVSPLPKYVSAIFYAASMALILFLATYKYFTGLLDYRFDLSVVGAAVFLFCAAGIYFLYSACKVIKDHEYYELLYLKLTAAPDKFKMVPPSGPFVKRWNRNQTWIAFFLIVSIPMTISPFIGLQHFYAVWETGNQWSEWSDIVAIAWAAAILTFAAVFHLWGSSMLVAMYNGHMRLETINREQLARDTKWIGAASTFVLAWGEPAERTTESLPERILTAIMITDIVGFSKDMEVDEEQTYAKLLKHNEIIRRNISENHGEELKTMGDAFLVRFKSAVAAVRAAMRIQEQLSEYNKDKDESAKIQVRIGIHIGDVLIMGGDVIGTGVNVAARIEPLAEPGGICISADVYNIVKKSIDLQVLSLGRKDLKNIRDAPEIYKIILQSATMGSDLEI